MTVHDSSTLSALIAAYQNSVVFEESVPNAFKVAKTFTQMRWSNGGLVLLGVRSDGDIVGIDPADLVPVYERFERLCADLTITRIELGTLTIKKRLVVFMIFNSTPRNLAPLARYSDAISNTKFV